jgi:hypothetical protein
MAIWGFKMESGANLHSGSKVGMQILAQQFCNLPVWYEEYKTRSIASRSSLSRAPITGS